MPPTLDWPQGLTPSPQVHALPIGDGVVLWNEATDEVHHLNPTAALVWQTVAAGEDLAWLAEEFQAVHPEGAVGVHHDVAAVVRELLDHRLIGADPEPLAASGRDTEGVDGEREERDGADGDGAAAGPSGSAAGARGPVPHVRDEDGDQVLEPADPDPRPAASGTGHDGGTAPQPPGRRRDRGQGLEQAVADRDWGTPLGPYRLGGYRFEVLIEDESLRPELLAAFGLLEEPPGGEEPARVLVRTRRDERLRYSVIHRDRRAALCGDATGVVLEVLRDLSRTVFPEAPHLVLHAAAVADERGALVIVGQSGSGKSTLCGALTALGHRYLADETVVVDPAGLAVTPVLRPLKLERRGADALDALLAGRPGASGRLTALNAAGTLRLPPPTDVTPHAVPVRGVVFSEYGTDAADALHPLSPAEALRGLLANRYATGLPPTDQLATAAALADRPCWRLTRSDLGTACDLLAAT